MFLLTTQANSYELVDVVDLLVVADGAGLVAGRDGLHDELAGLRACCDEVEGQGLTGLEGADLPGRDAAVSGCAASPARALIFEAWFEGHFNLDVGQVDLALVLDFVAVGVRRADVDHAVVVRDERANVRNALEGDGAAIGDRLSTGAGRRCRVLQSALSAAAERDADGLALAWVECADVPHDVAAAGCAAFGRADEASASRDCVGDDGVVRDRRARVGHDDVKLHVLTDAELVRALLVDREDRCLDDGAGGVGGRGEAALCGRRRGVAEGTSLLSLDVEGDFLALAASEVANVEVGLVADDLETSRERVGESYAASGARAVVGDNELDRPHVAGGAFGGCGLGERERRGDDVHGHADRDAVACFGAAAVAAGLRECTLDADALGFIRVEAAEVEAPLVARLGCWGVAAGDVEASDLAFFDRHVFETCAGDVRDLDHVLDRGVRCDFARADLLDHEGRGGTHAGRVVRNAAAHHWGCSCAAVTSIVVLGSSCSCICICLRSALSSGAIGCSAISRCLIRSLVSRGIVVVRDRGTTSARARPATDRHRHATGLAVALTADETAREDRKRSQECIDVFRAKHFYNLSQLDIPTTLQP